MNDPYGGRAEKLIRDGVAGRIRAGGGVPDVRVAEETELPRLLQAKLYEEADEFAASRSPEEAADLLEVVHALAALIGLSPGELERVRAEKAGELGGFTRGHVLRGHEQPPRPLVQKARALLLDGDDLLLFRRTRPGRAPYWTTPGGRVEDGDPDLPSALRREVWEELGATVGPLRRVFTFFEHRPLEDYRHHFYLCRLESMDLSQRCGPEFGDPSRGAYDVESHRCTGASFAGLELWPLELRDYLADEADGLPSLI
ncbi:NUDIX domain-containing protein [Actinocorallia longicatena]|uniref:Nudix hydrolase domain-containing protein n=1 Tax=Actinocorallia longicatena TaxID=111803 RepID=A0ABP6Q7R1_9ACTN